MAQPKGQSIETRPAIYVGVGEMESARVLALRLRRCLDSMLALAKEHRDLVVESESLSYGTIPDAAQRREIDGWNRQIAAAERALQDAAKVLEC